MDDDGYEIYLEEWKKQLESRDEYKLLLTALQNDPTNLVIQENVRAVGRLAGYDPNKVNNDIDKKLSNQSKSRSK